MVLRRIKARYTHGVLEPEEPLSLEEGAEVEVLLVEQVHASEEAEDAALATAIREGLTTERVTEETIAAVLSPENARARFLAAAGSWKGHSDPEELKRMISEARITGSREAPDL